MAMKMFKQKRGQVILVGIMVFIITFAAIISLITPVKAQITTARNATNLNCTNPEATVGEKGSCILVDLALPYFIGIVLAGAASYITMKRAGAFG